MNNRRKDDEHNHAARPVVLQVDGISYARSGKRILDNVSLKVHEGEFLVVAGPNGAGKSTLLKIISGELEPDAGTVSLFGKPLIQWDSKNLACRRAVLPQESSLNFPFSVLEVVLMGRIPHIKGFESKEDYRIAHEMLRAVSMEELAGQSYTTLSGGEKQRVQLARILSQVYSSAVHDSVGSSADKQKQSAESGSPLNRSPLLLLDEPTSSLDIARQFEVLQLARKIAQKGGGVFSILHDLNHASCYADTVALLKKGKLQLSGPPETTLTPEAIESVFSIGADIQRNPRTGHFAIQTYPLVES